METIKEGWECPRCHTVNAPSKEKCDCVKVEDKNRDTRKLLNE